MGGAACCQVGKLDKKTKPCMQIAKTKCAVCKIKSIGMILPKIDNGTTSRLMTGIANALAIGEIIETWPNMAMSKGSKPRVIAHCVLIAVFNVDTGFKRPTVINAISATAPNESQNPGAITAQGSTITTTNKAIASVREIAKFRPKNNVNAKVVSINNVRCVGTDIPASNA